MSTGPESGSSRLFPPPFPPLVVSPPHATEKQDRERTSNTASSLEVRIAATCIHRMFEHKKFIVYIVRPAPGDLKLEVG
jgi:hypothetical protein